MISLIRDHRRFFLGTAAAALALRLFFFFQFPSVTNDSRGYADIAVNWLEHGIYGETQVIEQITQIVPTDTRLPGYPAFLAATFWLFGAGNFKAVMLAQILFDLVTCFLIADLARRVVGERAAQAAFVLTAICPFLANYAAAALTETLEIFLTVLALDCAIIALDRMQAHEVGARRLWAATGGAIGGCILLRPDGGLLLVAIGFYLLWAIVTGAVHRGADTLPARTSGTAHAAGSGPGISAMFQAGVIVAVCALAPLSVWAARNFRTLHHFQPLAPRYANETDELVLRGFNRWVRTWMIDYASVEEIYWSVPGDKLDPGKLPTRAMENASQRETTLALIADYNQSQNMTSETDARFGSIASDRIRGRPVRYYLVLPLLRIADMWLRPRAEILPPDPRWWEFNDEPWSMVGTVVLGLVNLVYIGAALWVLARRRVRIRWIGLLLGFALLRSAFLGSLENPESRYTLECYPVVIVLAAAMAEKRRAECLR